MFLMFYVYPRNDRSAIETRVEVISWVKINIGAHKNKPIETVIGTLSNSWKIILIVIPVKQTAEFRLFVTKSWWIWFVSLFDFINQNEKKKLLAFKLIDLVFT